MDFLKNAAKLAQEMQGGGGAGHGNAAHGGGHGGVGDLMGAAEGMFAQHTTTTTTHRPASNYNDEYSGPEAIHTTTTHITSTQTTAPHQRPSTSELMSSGQALFQAASGGGKGDPTKLAGATSTLLEGLAAYGGLDKTPFGAYVEQASTFLEGHGRKPGAQGAVSGAGGGMEGPGAYHGTDPQHLSEGPAYGEYGGQGRPHKSQAAPYESEGAEYGSQDRPHKSQAAQYESAGAEYGSQGRPHKSQATQYESEGAEYGSQGRPHKSQYQSSEYGGQGRPHQSQAPHYPAESDEFGGRGQPRPSQYASETAEYGGQGRPRPSQYASETAEYGGQGLPQPQSQGTEYEDGGRPQMPQAPHYPPEGAEYYDQGPSCPPASGGHNKPSWYQ